jgi:putative component of membrane protein insertase Oxa1/YidC/SpoIIIJ protein YidD
MLELHLHDLTWLRIDRYRQATTNHQPVEARTISSRQKNQQHAESARLPRCSPERFLTADEPARGGDACTGCPSRPGSNQTLAGAIQLMGFLAVYGARVEMRTLLLWLIRTYQKNISPHKGFGCAYRNRIGGRSCSAFAFVAIRRYGALIGLLALRRRLRKCADAARLVRPPRRQFSLTRQEGHCDLPIGDCDCGHGCHASDLSNCPFTDDCGCGDYIEKRWRRWRATKRR